MNLAKNQTIQQLSSLFASVDDRSSNHKVWVDWAGNVHVDKSEVFQGIEESSVKCHLETCIQGNGYVGIEASRDKRYVEKELKDLLICWKKELIGYMDWIPCD
jgi:hypothetical protein